MIPGTMNRRELAAAVYQASHHRRPSAALVEDVVTSGGQVAESARALRALGGDVSAGLCVIDRESGGSGLLAADGITLSSLFRMSELEVSC
jgi:orotate phosphoribosyltransferase